MAAHPKYPHQELRRPQPSPAQFIMRWLVPRLLSMLLLGVLAACSGADDGDSDRIESLPLLVAEEDLRIGDADDPAAGFSRISLLDVDAEGNLYVVESSIPEIRVYRPDGGFLRRFGRRGAGPGEFERITTFGVQNDVVWTFDTRHRRITIFDRSGALSSTAPLEDALVPLTNGTGYAIPHRMLEDGTLSGRLAGLRYGEADPGLVSGPSDLIPVPVVRFSVAGEVLDTIGWTPRPPPGLWRPAAEERGAGQAVAVAGRNHAVPEPPNDWVELLQLADGYIIVERPTPASEDGGRVTATRVGLAGDTVYRREMGYLPPRYLTSDLDSIAARATRGEGLSFAVVGGSPPPIENPEAVTNRIRAAMQYPEFQMPIERAIATDDASVWIAYRPALADTTTWVILRPDGTPRGRLALPSGVSILWHSGDTLYASVPDEMDVPWLVRYTLRDP